MKAGKRIGRIELPDCFIAVTLFDSYLSDAASHEATADYSELLDLLRCANSARTGEMPRDSQTQHFALYACTDISFVTSTRLLT